MKELIKSAVERIREEPVAVVYFVQTGLGLLLAFGVALTAGQVSAVLAFTGAALWLFVRAKVVPEAKVRAAIGSSSSAGETPPGPPPGPAGPTG